jgi:hypothetical protein
MQVEHGMWYVANTLAALTALLTALTALPALTAPSPLYTQPSLHPALSTPNTYTQHVPLFSFGDDCALITSS